MRLKRGSMQNFELLNIWLQFTSWNTEIYTIIWKLIMLKFVYSVATFWVFFVLSLQFSITILFSKLFA